MRPLGRLLLAVLVSASAWLGWQGLRPQLAVAPHARPAAPLAAGGNGSAPRPSAPPLGFDGRYGESYLDVSREQGIAHYTLGSELLRYGEYYSAASHLAIAREALGDFGRICELLAITYDRLNMTPDLLDMMECLEREARMHASARALHDSLARHLDVEVEFQAAASDHFVVSFPSSGASAAAIGGVLAILEQARAEVAADIGLASGRLVPVVVYEGDQFAAATEKPHWALGLYDGKIRVAIDTYDTRPDVFGIALTHEYVHALTHEYTGTRLPAWFREGLADTFARRGTSREIPPRWRPGPADPVFPYDELAGEFLGWSQDVAAAAYQQSHALVQNLVAEADWEPLQELLTDLHRDPALSFDAAFRRVYGESPKDYVERWYDRVLR